MGPPPDLVDRSLTARNPAAGYEFRIVARVSEVAASRVSQLAAKRLGTATPVLAVTLLVLGASLAMQLWYLRHGTASPLGDIPGRYIVRGIRPGSLPYVDRVVEYPVLIGWAMWFASWIGRSPQAFFLVTAFGSAALALLLVVIVRARTGARVWHLALAPALFLYAFHNWDLLALVPAVVALMAFEAGADGWAGTLLAFGASAKVFPGLFLVPLVALRLTKGVGNARRLVVSAVVTTLVLNVPTFLASPSGWWFPARFQGNRPATWGTLWYWLLRVSWFRDIVGANTPQLANRLSIGALTLGLTAISLLAVRRRLDPYSVGAAVVAVFLLTNKVYSPNYDIWIVPFFALVTYPAWLRRVLAACSVAVFVLVYGMFHGLVSHATTVEFLPFVVVTRAAMLVAVIVIAVMPLRSSAAARDELPEEGIPALVA